jgi:REP element-mobilizing transposase RayT
MVVFGYVIMSNHIHFIVQSKDGKLSDLIRDFKKFTAKTILEKIQSEPESRREWMLERIYFSMATVATCTEPTKSPKKLVVN